MRLEDYILPIADVYAYCLMPNHYHLLLQIKSFETLTNLFNLKQEEIQAPDFHISDNLTHQIGSFQNSYTKIINARKSRKGALFMQSFGRKLVTKEAYLYKLVHYIHYNPVHHGFVGELEDWEYSSYNHILAGKDIIINSRQVIDLFGSVEKYHSFHQQTPDERLIYFMENFD
ncbi:MAG: transposase [Bacteroidetes bacterium]|nr:MAG: transposase [Bacteroidota bacterium]